jgi:hypothetical protein
MSNASPARGLVVALLAVAPLAAHSQVFKCAQPGGSTSYQPTPCKGNAAPATHPTAAQLNAAREAQPAAEPRPYVDTYATPPSARPRAPGPPKPSVASPTGGMRRIDSEEERRRACTIALNNDAVLSRGRKAYSFDKDGNQNWVQDDQRAGLLSSSKKQEARYCE